MSHPNWGTTRGGFAIIKMMKMTMLKDIGGKKFTRTKAH